MLILVVYFIKLFVAPQWWLEPFIGLRVDLILYPIWFAYLFFSGKLTNLFSMSSQRLHMILFVCWMILSIIMNDKNQHSTLYIVEYITWFVLFCFLQATVVDESKMLSAIKWMVGIIFILVVESIQHKLSPDGIGWAGQSLGWVLPEVLAAGGTGRTQWISIFDGPGVFCLMFTTALPFLFLGISKDTPKFKKFIFLMLIAALLVAIYFTGSRGGFLATLSIFFAYGLYRYKVSFSKVVMLGAVFSIALMVAPSYLTKVKDSKNSAQNRVDVWGEGAEMVQYNPVLGIGRGNYAAYTGRLIAHNSAIEIMGETGFIGLYLWVALIYLSLKSIYVYYNQSEVAIHRELSTLLGISIIGYMVSSMFVTAEFETFYMLLAFAGCYGRFANQKVELSQRERLMIGGGVIGFWVFVKIFVTLYFG